MFSLIKQLEGVRAPWVGIRPTKTSVKQAYLSQMNGHFLRFPVPPRASLALSGAEDGHAVLTVDDHGLSVHLNSSSTTNLVGPVHGGQDFGVTLYPKSGLLTILVNFHPSIWPWLKGGARRHV